MKRSLLALALLAVLAVGATSVRGYFFGGWPETCLEMNDMVEASPRGSGAVGIYQRAFGSEAEQACRNDHIDDVRRAFAWAIGQSPQPAPSEFSYSALAQDLSREFQADQYASGSKYRGKFIRVTGTVEEAGLSSFIDEWEIEFDRPDYRHRYVECRMQHQYGSWTEGLQDGQEVSIIGYFRDFTDYRIRLVDCRPAV